MSILYLGAGWDNDFLYRDDLKSFKKFILVDGLPNNKYYEKYSYLYKFISDNITFFHTLYNSYGKLIEHYPNKKLRIYKRNGKTILYYYNTNAETFKIPYDVKDIIIRGYLPKNIEFYKLNGYLYCDHLLDIHKYNIIKFICLNNDECWCC